MSNAQKADLDQLLNSLQDRRSPQYHKFLSPEQYAARFGMNQADIAQVIGWLERNGFSNIEVARSHTWIGFNGSAAQVQSAFQTTIRHYLVDGEAHFANAGDPILPKALEGMVLGIRGLHNFQMQPLSHEWQPRLTDSIGSTFLAPDDWQTIYDVKPLYGAGWDGSPLNTGPVLCGATPCSIVVVGQTDVQASDLAAFRTASNLSPKAVTVLIPSYSLDPGYQSGDENESDLDLEWSNAIAPNASVLFVTTDFTSNNGVVDSEAYAIDNNVAAIMSISYGICESYLGSAEVNSREALHQQAAAQGMTVVAASGDSGPANCSRTDYPVTTAPSVLFPASSPYVTAVGGTTLKGEGYPYWSTSNNVSNGSALQYMPEQVWNDSNAYFTPLASGGGASALFTKPSWQIGSGVPADGQRDLPDISLAASPFQSGYLYCPHSYCVSGFLGATLYLRTIGGTSAGAPTFAGVLALLVQKTGSRLGNINQNLYTVAESAPAAFHDITVGSNFVSCALEAPGCDSGQFGYNAGAGYDQATGLGSIDSFNLVEQWGADIQLSASLATVNLSAGTSTTTTLTVAPVQGFTGPVTLGCSVSSSLANVTCSAAPHTVNTSGTATLTITAGGSAQAFPFSETTPLWPPLVLSVLLLLLRKPKKLYLWSTAAAFTILLFAAVSCGGGSSSGTPTPRSVPESGNIMVTATSGQIRNQILIAVSVQ
jgi:subtilase family serine protease